MGSLALIAIAGILPLAPLAVRLMFGDAFSDAVMPLRILSIALALSFIATPLAWALVATEGQNALARTGLVAASVNVGMNLIAILRWGATGAAVTTVVTEVVVVILNRAAVARTAIFKA